MFAGHSVLCPYGCKIHGGAAWIGNLFQWRARSTPGQARAADSGSKLPHSI